MAEHWTSISQGHQEILDVISPGLLCAVKQLVFQPFVRMVCTYRSLQSNSIVKGRCQHRTRSPGREEPLRGEPYC